MFFLESFGYLTGWKAPILVFSPLETGFPGSEAVSDFGEKLVFYIMEMFHYFMKENIRAFITFIFTKVITKNL
jgi:hypothetical protein